MWNLREWWCTLPTTEVLTTAEARKRYGTHLDGTNWNIAAKASRQYISLNFDKSHAYLEIAIPNVDGAHYTIYNFGKCASYLPANEWEKMKMFAPSLPAAIVYPDENVFFSERQHVGYSFELTSAEGRRFMEAIKDDILRARSGNMAYQIESENCCKWIQTHLEEQLGCDRVPNLYRVQLLNTEPEGNIRRLFNIIRKLPAFCQSKALALVHLPLGAWKGRWVVEKNGQRVWKSLVASTFWQDTEVYLPGYLHKQTEKGVFAAEPERHKVTTRGYFDMKTKGIR